MKRVLRCFGVSIVVLAMAGSVAPALAEDLANAKSNFATFCVTCHGEQGKGDGPSAASLKTKPRDFTNCAEMAKVPDKTLFEVIEHGGASAGLSAEMPAWAQGFDDDEVKGLVAYIRSLCKK